MADLHAEPRECCERVDDEPAPVAIVVVVLVGVWPRLDGTVDTHRVGGPLVLPPGMGLASLGARRDVTESTTNKFLLYYSASLSASRAAPLGL